MKSDIKELTLVILAGGQSSRFGRIKQLEPMDRFGNTLMDYSIYDAVEFGITKIAVVTHSTLVRAIQNHINERFRDRIVVEYVLQDELAYQYVNRLKPLGTGHALWCVKNIVKSPLIVINADDFYGRSAYQKMAGHLRSNSSRQALIGYRLDAVVTEGGGVSRGICSTNERNQLIDITELTNLRRSKDTIINKLNNETIPNDSLVSMNFWGFQPSIFDYADSQFKTFINNLNSDANDEFYITEIVKKLIDDDGAVDVLRSNDQWLGVTHPGDEIIVGQGLDKLIEEGLYPRRLLS